MTRLPKGFRIRGSAVVRDIYHRGKRLRVTVGTTDELGLAVARAPEVEAQARAKIDGTIEVTVAGLADRWVRERLPGRRTPEGVKLAEQRLRDHILPVIGGIAADRLGEDALWRLRNVLDRKAKARSGQPLSPQTVLHILSEVRSLLSYGERARNAQGRRIVPVGENPWNPDLLPRIERPEPKGLTDQEIDRLVAACTNGDQEFAIRFLVLTGLRWSEFRGLDWTDVRMEPVPHLLISKTKSRRLRSVPLLPEAVELLEERRRRVGAIAGPVSPYRNTNGGSLAHSLVIRTGIAFHVHRLRHTWGTRMRVLGIGLAAIQAGLGHADARTTERYAPQSFDLLTMALQSIPPDRLRSCSQAGRRTQSTLGQG